MLSGKTRVNCDGVSGGGTGTPGGAEYRRGRLNRQLALALAHRVIEILMPFSTHRQNAIRSCASRMRFPKIGGRQSSPGEPPGGPVPARFCETLSMGSASRREGFRRGSRHSQGLFHLADRHLRAQQGSGPAAYAPSRACRSQRDCDLGDLSKSPRRKPLRISTWPRSNATS
jgi:hypothetical protein